MNTLTIKQIDILKAIGELQHNIMEETGVVADSMLQFKFEGVDIVNPFVDESGTCEVEPVEYYGETFSNSGFIKFVEKF